MLSVMKRPLSLRAACLLGIVALSLTGWSQDQKPGEVTKLNGQKSFGLIEITDDYTIRVTSDTGLQKIPIAMLSESDFRKFGFTRDRGKDGRFWSERQDALEAEKKDGEAQPGEKKKDHAALEVRLAEIAAFQPFIDAYEKTVADKKSSTPENKATDKAPTSTTAGSSPMNKIFSQSGMGSAPFTGGFTSSATQPVTSAGAAAASIVTPALPVPSAP